MPACGRLGAAWTAPIDRPRGRDWAVDCGPRAAAGHPARCASGAQSSADRSGARLKSFPGQSSCCYLALYRRGLGSPLLSRAGNDQWALLLEQASRASLAPIPDLPARLALSIFVS
jgi:hypothetical protein